MYDDWVYVLAFLALVMTIVSWRGGTSKFLAEFGKSRSFNYAVFLLDMHIDLVKAVHLSVAHRRVVPPVFVHAASLIAMWAFIVTGSAWSK